MVVRWLHRAYLDMEGLRAWIEADNPEAAASEVDRVLEATRRLNEFPASGRPGRVNGTRELVVSTYVVAYRVKGDVVEILRVLHLFLKF